MCAAFVICIPHTQKKFKLIKYISCLPNNWKKWRVNCTKWNVLKKIGDTLMVKITQLIKYFFFLQFILKSAFNSLKMFMMMDKCTFLSAILHKRPRIRVEPTNAMNQRDTSEKGMQFHIFLSKKWTPSSERTRKGRRVLVVVGWMINTTTVRKKDVDAG